MIVNFFYTLKFRILLAVFVVVLSATSSIAYFVRQNVIHSTELSQQDSARNILESIYHLVDTEHKSILFHKAASLRAKKKELKDVISIAINNIEYFHSLASRGKISEKHAKKEALKVLNALRYDDGIGYIWINDVKRPYPKMIMHPTVPSLNGKILDDPKFNNALGEDKNLFQAFVDIVLWQREGYVNYQWPKPVKGGLTEVRSKISFVKLFKPWNWVIGTGLYLDDIEEEAKKRSEVVLKELRSVFSKTRIGRTGYLYLFDSKHTLKIHPSLEGKDMSEVINPSSGNILFDDVAEATNYPGVPFRYLWDKPPFDQGNFTYWKNAYARFFEPLGWYIVSTYYEDEIYVATDKINREIILITVIILIISLIASYFISETLVRPIKRLIKFVKQFDVSNLNDKIIPIEGVIETKELAISFREMVNSIAQSREELLQREGVLQAIYDRSFQSMCLLDLNGVLLSANKTSLDSIQCLSEDVCGKFFWDTPWWNHSVDAQKQLQGAIESAKNGKFTRFETIFPLLKGGGAHIDFSLNPILDASGKVVSMLAEGRDVTARKIAELNRLKNIHFLSSLEKINQTLSGHSEIDVFLSLVTTTILDIYKCDRILIINHGEIDRIVMSKYVPQFSPAANYEQISLSCSVVSNLYAQAITNSKVVDYLYDGDEESWRAQTTVPFKSCLMISLPIEGGEMWSLELHQCDHKREWDENEKRLLQEIASRISSTVATIVFQQSVVESERLVRDIIDNSSSIISLKNLNGHYITVNKQFENEFSVRKEDIEGNPDNQIFSPDRAAKYQQNDDRVIREQKGIQVEENFYTKDGERYYLATKFPLYDGENKLYAICSISTDITERKEVERTLENLVEARTKEIESKNIDLENNIVELKKIQKRLVAQEKLASLGTLASGIAHEIKNPLNFIINSGRIITQLIAKLDVMIDSDKDRLGEDLFGKFSGFSAQLTQISELVTKHGIRSDKIIRTMIDFTSTEESELTEVEIKDSLEEVISLSYNSTRQRLGRLAMPALTIEGVGKAYVYPSEFQRALINILENAIYAVNRRATELGDSFHPKIAVDATRIGDLINIVISDNGDGISKEVVEKIFDPFVTDKPAGEGSGLGLAMAYDVVAKHHGEITFARVDKHTQFIVQIPINLKRNKENI